MTCHDPFTADTPTKARFGRISLVGAGPGARDRLTLRAVDRIRAVDIVFYDRLVDPSLLQMCRDDCRKTYVGKAVGAHEWSQDAICRAITSAALSGLSVVRLNFLRRITWMPF